jgi:hypothetical protein
MVFVMSNHANAVQDGMARPTADTVQITFRIPSHWLHQADAVATVLSRHGMEATRTDAFREAIARGMEEIIKDASATQYRVQAWDGRHTTCLFWFGRDEKTAIDTAEELARQHTNGRWTIFRVFKGDEHEPMFEKLVGQGATPRERVRNRAETLAKAADRRKPTK